MTVDLADRCGKPSGDAKKTADIPEAYRSGRHGIGALILQDQAQRIGGAIKLERPDDPGALDLAAEGEFALDPHHRRRIRLLGQRRHHQYGLCPVRRSDPEKTQVPISAQDIGRICRYVHRKCLQRAPEGGVATSARRYFGRSMSLSLSAIKPLDRNASARP